MSAFRFLDLPDELRLKMYRHILPLNERIHLDPDQVQFPIPYITEQSYGDTLRFLLVCKQIHVEATEFIYGKNTVNIIKTAENGDFLQELGFTACHYIAKLECHVDAGLVDLGDIWLTLSDCPRLTDLRLVFYHELVNWSRTLAQLAYYRAAYADTCLVDLDVELHSSIWSPRDPAQYYAHQFRQHIDEARRHALMYQWELPHQFRHITITASVYRTAWSAFARLIDVDELWRFESVDESPNVAHRTTLRYRKIVPETTENENGAAKAVQSLDSDSDVD